MTTRRPVGRSERLLAALTAAALVPVWLFRFFPTQDGPSHLYNAFVLARLGAASSTVTREFFELNRALFPNWTTYLLMAPLTRLLPPLVVQQIVISLCVIAIPAATLYLQKSFKEESDPSALLGVLLAYSYMLFLGFFNFVLGAALFAVVIGFWWRRRDGSYIVALYALLLLTYFTHGFPFAAALLAISVLAAIEKRWRLIAELLPAYALFAVDAISRIGAAPEFRSVAWHVRNLVDLRPLVFFGDVHIWIARVVLVALLIGSLFAIVKRRRHSISLVTAAMLVGYFVAPWGYGAGGWALGGWINDRFLFLAVMTLPAWIEAPRRIAVYAAAAAVAAVHVGVTATEIANEHARIGAVVNTAGGYIRPHTTVQQLGSVGETTARVTPMLHVVSYLALRDDVVNLGNYEARLRDFPLAFRADAPKRAPDYLVVWRTARVRRVAGYKLLFDGGDLRLFSRAGL